MSSQTFIIQHSRPWRKILFICSTILILATVAWFSYWYGKGGTEHYSKGLSVENKQLTEKLKVLESNYEQARRDIAKYKRSSVVDVKAKKEVETWGKQLQQQVFDLQEELKFYKNILAANPDGSGVKISRFAINATANSNIYAYKLVLSNAGADGNLISGKVKIILSGDKDGEKMSLTLDKLAKLNSSNSIPYRFKFIQELNGNLTLPQGFNPKAIRVVVNTVGKKGTIDKTFYWKLKDENNAIGKQG